MGMALGPDAGDEVAEDAAPGMAAVLEKVA